jgi:hypothetical protein
MTRERVPTPRGRYQNGQRKLPVSFLSDGVAERGRKSGARARRLEVCPPSKRVTEDPGQAPAGLTAIGGLGARPSRSGLPWGVAERGPPRCQASAGLTAIGGFGARPSRSGLPWRDAVRVGASSLYAGLLHASSCHAWRRPSVIYTLSFAPTFLAGGGEASLDPPACGESRRRRSPGRTQRCPPAPAWTVLEHARQGDVGR